MASSLSLPATKAAYVQELCCGSSRRRRRLLSASVRVSCAVPGQTWAFVLTHGGSSLASGCIALLSGSSEASAKPKADKPRARLDQFFSVAAVFGLWGTVEA